MESITINELVTKLPQINIIDIRDNYEYNLGTIPTSMNIPASFLIMNPDNYLNKDNIYYIFCEYGNTSKRCCLKLEKEGYHTIDVLGGYDEYKRHANTDKNY